MEIIGAALLGVAFLVIYYRKREKPTQASEVPAYPWQYRNGTMKAKLSTTQDKEDLFVAEMKQIASKSGGSVEVRVPSGRRHRTDNYSITLAEPALLNWGRAITSADVIIEDVRYAFHAIYHPKANQYAPDFYYVVTGPNRDTDRKEEFEVYPQGFKWTCAGRPWNPLLVKYVLKQWAGRNDVINAIQHAEKALPKPKKRETHN